MFKPFPSVDRVTAPQIHLLPESREAGPGAARLLPSPLGQCSGLSTRQQLAGLDGLLVAKTELQLVKGSGRKVMLLSDDPGTGFLIQALLQAQGHTVFLYEDTMTAKCSLVTQEKFDLLLVDLHRGGGGASFEAALDLSSREECQKILLVNGARIDHGTVQRIAKKGWRALSRPVGVVEVLLAAQGMLKRPITVQTGSKGGINGETAKFSAYMSISSFRDDVSRSEKSGGERADGRARRTPLKEILLLGNEFLLLRTRGQILERFGYEVTALQQSECWHELPFDQFHLVHICQSVEPEEAAKIAEQSRAVNPRSIVVYTDEAGRADARCFDELLPPLLPPSQYVRRLSLVLERCGA